MQVIKRDGSKENVKLDKITKRIESLTKDLHPLVEPIKVAIKTIDGIFDGVSTKVLDNLAAENAATMATIHPDYSRLAARIAITSLHKETQFSFLEMIERMHKYVNPRNGRYAPMISDELYHVVIENHEKIEKAIKHQRDMDYDFFGFKTLERSYLLKENGIIIERPQHMIMRVSLGIHGSDLKSAFETYELMSKKYFTHATPTLFNSGTPKPQMSSCFLIDMIDDSIAGIYDTLKSTALISQSAGGVGLAVHKIRAKGTHIAGTNGTSNGLVPMLRVFNDTAKYVDQCFTGDTLVQTSIGHKRIDSLQVGDAVITHDRSAHKIQNIKTFEKSEFVKINGIKVTPDHLFAVCTNYSDSLDKNNLLIEWKHAKDIVETDCLVSIK